MKYYYYTGEVAIILAHGQYNCLSPVVGTVEDVISATITLDRLTMKITLWEE